MEKGLFFEFLNFVFYSLERRFLTLEYRKRHFLGIYCLKKKLGKIAIFKPKPWLNPLEKCQFFDLLNFLFYRVVRRFFALEYHKRHFPGLYCLKKNLEKPTFLDQNYGLTLWKNVNFSTFLTSCFYSLERRFFALEYHKRHFSGLYCLKKNSFKKSPFLDKNHGFPFGKMSFFLLFEHDVFIA